MSSTVVIFGGSGFIGSHLIKRLSQAGETVVSIDRREPRERIAGVQYLLKDVRDLSDLMIDGPVSRIYNFAAVHTTPGHPTHEYYDTNIAGASEITQFAKRKNVDEIIFTSSISVYGPSEDRLSEQSKPNPQSAYGWSKLLAEKIHKAWQSEAPDRRLTVVRPAVVFGPHEGGNFTRLSRLLAKGFFIYPGRTDTVKACIYVEDLLDAIEYARSQNQGQVLFNGAYSPIYTIKDIVTTFSRNHFPKARTFVVPKGIIYFAAACLKPLSASGLGIHPERIMKLVRSTNIEPGWLDKQGWTPPRGLEVALNQWSAQTNGKFD
ncbi:NAD(P)-dependent oxidoreductase [Asticcacaulis sp. AND118]|uniref:NAD-dependent epimerase/dehydratase family protein n=1 Tax=Asticcacaulis sp. AND118 TaxID=2840468 RepID=UPI001CFFC9EE|nr:NAD-dependent epimerase/dehydratase family protein [Asticcacaulis sp. AND118]UDF05040.1 NAD-dependent epimerase/dehydratase family protein [Asticcacaulis sp. AND118]